MKLTSALFLSMALVAGSTASAAVIDSFENATEWAGVAPYGTDVAVSSVNSTDFTEGSGAIQVDYTYEGGLYYDGGVEKTFATPIDLSAAKEFSIDIKGDANSSQAGMIWYAQFKDVNGQIMHIWLSGGDTTVDGEWRRYTWSVADINWTVWGQAAGNTPATLSQVASMTFRVQCQDGAIPAGSMTFLLDNLQYQTTTSLMTETMVEDFEAYADETALDAAWVAGASSPTTADVTLATSGAPEGSQALQEAITVVDGSTNWSGHAKYTFASPIDIDAIDGFSMYFKGDASLPVDHGGVYVSLGDAAGNEARWMCVAYTDDGTYNKLVMEVDPVGSAGTDPIAEELWDAGGTLDRSAVTYIKVWYVDGTSPIVDHTLTLNVDAIESMVSTDGPYVSTIPADVPDWQLY